MAFGDRVGPSTDARPAAWIALETGDFGTVGGFVPARFDRYLLIEHRPGDFERDWDAPPELVQRLVEVLVGHTSTPEAGWFAVWEGFGFDDSADDDLAQVPTFELPNRRYYLLTGAITAAATLVRPGSDTVLQPPDLWWPDDRAWFVATDTDLPWSYLGASDDVCSHVATVLSDATRPVAWADWNGSIRADLSR